MNNKKRILILGSTGLLGSTMFNYFSKISRFTTLGTIRDEKLKNVFRDHLQCNIISNINANDFKVIEKIIDDHSPDVIINCIGIIKQLKESEDPVKTLTINSIFPHKLLNICKLKSIKLIHFSTDCVFSGKDGMYIESSFPDADDLYGRSKFLGEINDINGITLRTSMIGHECNSNRSLLNWFLSSKKMVKGYRNVIFSGLPAIELSKIVDKYIIDNDSIHGLYHVASKPIDKYNLLNIISSIYEKNINIIPDDDVRIDRSLNANCFNEKTGYNPPEWEQLIKEMKQFNES